VLQISNPKPAGTKASYYFNYYSRDTNGQAIWYGKGAEYFGLYGTVEREKFSNLLNGFTPDKNIALVKNAGDPNRQAFWDLTFSVPKAVSVAWVMGSDKDRWKIERAIGRALKTTLQHVEKEFGLSRRGAGGKMWVPAVLTFALFPHINSRANQPHLHFHCLLFNLGIREDGTVGTLQTKSLFDAKLALGLYFRHELARELTNDLGFKITHTKSGFEIAGVAKEICDYFSKRRHQIIDYMRSHEMSGGKDAKIAAVATRAPKQHISQDVRLKGWQKEAAALGFSQLHTETPLRKNHLKEVPELSNVVVLRPAAPLDKRELFQRWCEKTEQREFVDEQDLDELGIVFSNDPANPLSPPNKNRKPAIQDAWREFKKGSYECFDNWFQSKNEELQDEQKSQFRIVKGGADHPNNQEKSNKKQNTSPGELTRIRLKTREEERADFFARHPHLDPDAKRTSNQHSSSEKFGASNDQFKSNDFGAKNDSQKDDKQQPDQRAKAEENEKSKRDEFKRRFQYAESEKRHDAKQPPQSESPELKKFKRELHEAFEKIFPENQKPRKVERVAFAIGAKFEISASDILEAVDELKLPIHRRFYRVEFKSLFPNAPRWNRLAHIKTPRIVLQNTARKWGKIHWSKPIPALFGSKIEVRWQEKRLFPKAPGWSPFSKLSVNALRFAPYRDYAYGEKPTLKPKPKPNLKKEEKEKNHNL
jgi:conjugative relaxase-like TrwC/TraI family protein